MKHTKGPWKASSFEGDIKIQAAGAAESIAIVHDQMITNGAEANAALIAAAPEMLEALEVLAAHCPNSECEKVIRALINKAKGGTE